MIVENTEIEQLKQIFKENHGQYLTDKNAISSDMLKVVYEQDKEALGYAVIYEGIDFCEKEQYNLKIEDIQMPCVYIWQLATKKGFEGQGIANHILQYVVEKFKNYEIYACVNIQNVASMKVHCKNGFIPIKYFEEQKKDGRIDKNLMLRRERKKQDENTF